LGLLVGGLCACGGQQTAQNGVDFDSQGFEGLTSTHFDLLSTACTFSGTGNTTANITIADGEFAYIFYRSTDSQVVVNANNAGGTECAFPSTYKIAVTATGATSHKILFDFLSGTFALGSSTAPNGITVALGSGTNTLEIRGTNSADLITFGTNAGGTTFASYAFGATAHTYTDMSMTGVTDILVSTGPGDDVITGQGGITTTAIPALSGAINLTIYGGDGNDIITSGAAGTGVNSLNGNSGSDRFPQVLGVLAHDVVSGGADATYTYGTTATGTATATYTSHLSATGTTTATVTNTGTTTATRTLTATNTVTNTNTYTQTDISVDVVDYSARTTPIRVTLGDDSVAVKASSTITCVSPSMIHDHDRFTINDGTDTQTFEYHNSVDAVSTASITAPASNTLLDNDTFTINDGTNSATFVIKATTATVTATPAELLVDIHLLSTANDMALAIFNAITAYKGVATLDVTPTSPTAATVVIETPAVSAVTLVSQAGSGNLTLVNTPGVHWASAFPTIDVYGLTTDVQVASTTAAAIPGTISPVTTVAATSSGSVVTVKASTTGARASFLVTKVAGAFAVANISIGSAAPGANDGDIAGGGEQDSIKSDVENVIGSSGNDYIDASEAYLTSHILQGMAGNDTLIIGVLSTVSNTLYGGLGNDILQGGSGIDTLYGGDGNDSLRGGLENDTIDGGNVNCLVASAAVAPSGATPPKAAIYASSLCTTTYAAAGTSAGNNTLDYSDRTLPVVVDLSTLTATGTTRIGQVGEKDNVTSCEYLRGGSGADTLTGSVNPNMIWGGPGDDVISGGAGNDTLYGEMGNDTISGNAGDDYLYGGPGINTIYGDTNGDLSVVGNDLVDNSEGTLGTIECGPGDMDVLIPNGGETSNGCEL